MNRLRESRGASPATRWLLAAAYRRAGLGDAADALVADAPPATSGRYDTSSPTFASPLRDEALRLLALDALGRHPAAARAAEDVSRSLLADRFHSTQATAFALIALSRHAGTSGGDTGFEARHAVAAGAPQALRSSGAVARVALEGVGDEPAPLEVFNDSRRVLYATTSLRGVPTAGSEQASARGLRLDVQYATLSGEPLDVGALEQGSDFASLVALRNQTGTKVENIALTWRAPSGWEIRDARPAETDSGKAPAEDHRDLRDDRVHHYFGLEPGQTRRFRITLNAAYQGRFYLPATLAEAMYDETVHARNVGRWVEVTERPTAGGAEHDGAGRAMAGGAASAQ